MNHFHSLTLMLLALGAGASARAQEAAPVPVAAIVDEVLARNPERAYYEAELEAARAGRRSAGAWSDPELSLDAGRKRVRDASRAVVGEGTAWSVSVTQTFEWPGRIALRKAIANRDVALAELGLSQFEAALAARARTLAYGLHAANTKAASVREVAERFAALKETFLARDPAGVTPLLETRVIEANELSVQRRATEAELQLQEALIELNQLRGVSAETPLRVAAAPVEVRDLPEPRALLAAARENNFEFRMRRVEVEQQGFEVRLARHERYPAVSVSPFYSVEKAGERESVVGVGLSLPLPVTARTGAGIQLAEARQRQAEAAMLVAERELEREVFTTAQAFATKAREMQRWSGEPIARFREAAELADRHYRTGAVPLTTYVELQSAYLEAVAALLETELEALEAGLRLQLLTGLEQDLVRITQP